MRIKRILIIVAAVISFVLVGLLAIMKSFGVWLADLFPVHMQGWVSQYAPWVGMTFLIFFLIPVIPAVYKTVRKVATSIGRSTPLTTSIVGRKALPLQGGSKYQPALASSEEAGAEEDKVKDETSGTAKASTRPKIIYEVLSIDQTPPDDAKVQQPKVIHKVLSVEQTTSGDEDAEEDKSITVVADTPETEVQQLAIDCDTPAVEEPAVDDVDLEEVLAQEPQKTADTPVIPSETHKTAQEEKSSDGVVPIVEIHSENQANFVDLTEQKEELSDEGGENFLVCAKPENEKNGFGADETLDSEEKTPDEEVSLQSLSVSLEKQSFETDRVLAAVKVNQPLSQDLFVGIRAYKTFDDSDDESLRCFSEVIRRGETKSRSFSILRDPGVTNIVKITPHDQYWVDGLPKFINSIGRRVEDNDDLVFREYHITPGKSKLVIT